MRLKRVILGFGNPIRAVILMGILMRGMVSSGFRILRRILWVLVKDTEIILTLKFIDAGNEFFKIFVIKKIKTCFYEITLLSLWFALWD